MVQLSNPDKKPSYLSLHENGSLCQRIADADKYYINGVRFYLDFYHNYNFRQEENESLSDFMGKLQEKKQSEKQRKQAQESTANQPVRTKKETFYQVNKQIGDVKALTREPATTEREALRSSGADWTEVYKCLVSRHLHQFKILAGPNSRSYSNNGFIPCSID